MDFDFTDEQKMLTDSAARYVRERCDLDSRRKAAKTPDGFSRQHWAHFAQQGWLALTLPESAGGLDLDMVDMAILMEELGRGLVAEPVVDSAILCGQLLASSANDAARNELLPGLASGDILPALAHRENDGRCEYDTQVTARAKPAEQGWTLNGSKPQVFYGNSATHLLVSAEISGDMGYSLFVVDATSPGIRVDVYPLIDGTRAADIHFTDVAIPASAQIHSAGSAAKAMDSAVNHAIVALSAAAIGSMEAVMAMTADYLKTREQYGQPLAQFQALKHRMAEMLVETEQARAMLFCALAALQSSDREERRHAVSGLKALVAQAGLFVTGQGIQLHGGIGVTEEYAVGHHYKALLVYDKRFGDSDFHLERRARLLA